MNEQREEGLEIWILEWFQRNQIVEKEQPVARRYFLREFDQLQADESVDALRERMRLIDPDSPGSGTYGDWVEGQVEASLVCYRKAIDDGHGPAYSEEYGYLCGSEEYSSDRASVEAYKIINNGRPFPADSPGYQDAYQACISREKSPEFAKYCADYLMIENCSFDDAFKASTEFEKAYHLMLTRGHSDLRARMYAERMRGGPSTDFAEFYAESVEEQLQQGRSQSEAETFAEIHAGILCDYGKPDEDELEYEIWELHLRAQAEALYRYQSEYGDKALFLHVFDQIHQRLPRGLHPELWEWFDEVEARTKQELAARGSQIGPNGCLSQVKTAKEEEHPVEAALPKPPDFRNMSEKEFTAFRRKSEEEEYAHQQESEYRDWCEEMECDPLDPDSRDAYKECLEETGDGFWENLDDDDRDGWTDNMNKE